MTAIPDTLTDLAVDVDDLVPYPGNPRRGNIDAVAESLRVNGQYRPIVVRKGTREVLAGNHTLAAAKSLGWEKIAATFVDVDDEQAKRIVLVDNRANDLAGYDSAALADLLGELPDLAGTGYNPADLEQILAELDQANGPTRLTDPDSVPRLPKGAKSTEGDVFCHSGNRLQGGVRWDLPQPSP